MRDLLWPALEEAKDLAEIKKAVVEILSQVRRGGGRVGYAAGIITSDGPQHADRNFKALGEYTDKLKKQHSIPVISATEVFSQELLKKVLSWGVTEKDFVIFWRSVLCCGHVTDLFMTPRWELSRGARDEHETAKKLGIKIHYLE